MMHPLSIDTTDIRIQHIPQTPYGFRKRLQFIIACVERFLPQRSFSSISILDVGCGSGSLVAMPLAQLGFRIHGIDLHAETIAFAQQQHRLPNLSFSCQSLQTVDDTYDVVICSEVLEHVADPQGFVRDVMLRVRSSGICILTTPNGRGPFEIAEALYKMYRPLADATGLRRLLRPMLQRAIGSPSTHAEPVRDTFNEESPHIQFFTRRRLLSLVQQAGSHVLTFRPRSFLCGHGFDLIIGRNEAWAEWNSAIADALPLLCASDWMLCLRPEQRNVETADEMKRQVQQYWEAQPCGTEYASSRYGTRPYFDEIERARYDLEPFIPRYAGFATARGQRVLEIGCGAGTDHLQFARSGAETYGIDITAHSARLVKQRFAVYGFDARMQVADAENLPFPDASFDLVYSWGVLHHTPSTEATINEVRRVLKPGGRFVIMLYNRHSLVAFKLYMRYGLLAGQPRRSLSELLSQYMESPGTKGYTVNELEDMFRAFHNVTVTRRATPYDLPDRLKPWTRWLVPFVPNFLGWFAVVRGQKASDHA